VGVCEIGDTLSWSAARFFVWHLLCCLEVRGWRTSCHKVTSRNFLLSLRALYDMFEKRETSYTFKMKYSIARSIENVVPPSLLILALGVLSSQFPGF
jgi:hypothetical protein